MHSLINRILRRFGAKKERTLLEEVEEILGPKLWALVLTGDPGNPDFKRLALRGDRLWSYELSVFWGGQPQEVRAVELCEAGVFQRFVVRSLFPGLLARARQAQQNPKLSYGDRAVSEVFEAVIGAVAQKCGVSAGHEFALRLLELLPVAALDAYVGAPRTIVEAAREALEAAVQ